MDYGLETAPAHLGEIDGNRFCRPTAHTAREPKLAEPHGQQVGTESRQ